MANWSTGSVQKIQSFNEHVGRVLSTKLKDRFLVTLGEVIGISEVSEARLFAKNCRTWTV
jgi:hypothetical protein